MRFSYDAYVSANLTGQLAPLLMFAVLAFFSISESRRKEERKRSVMSVLGRLAAVVMCLCVIGYYAGPLFRGGLALLREQSAHAVTKTGTVEELREQPWYYGSYYKLDEWASPGWQVVIDGETYRMMHHANLAKGDEVTIEVLPESRFVLSIVKTE